MLCQIALMKWEYNSSNQVKEQREYYSTYPNGNNPYLASRRNFYYTSTAPNGISKLNNAMQYSIVPNPNNGTFTIEGADATAIQIMDITGKLYNYSKSGNTIQISNAPSGMYWLQITDSNHNMSVQQIIKN
jgi:hypothetical protein